MKPSTRPFALRLERERERVRRDDRVEGRPHQRRKRAIGVVGRREPHHRVVARERARDAERIFRRPVERERVENARNADRDAGAHEHGRHARKHRTVHRGQERQLDLLEVVDPDGAFVALARESDLDEVRDDAELDQVARGTRPRVHRDGPVGRALGPPALDEMAREDARGHLPERETWPSRGACARRRRHPAGASRRSRRARSPKRHRAGRGAIPRSRASSSRRRRPCRPG